MSDEWQVAGSEWQAMSGRDHGVKRVKRILGKEADKGR